MNEAMNILVVDDDEAILEVFEDFFETAGTHSVLTARDGREALDIFDKTKVDFCFTDLNMPRMDGIELTAKLHEIDNTIPVVVMTGYPTTDNAIATLKHGVVDYLLKPFSIADVSVTINRVLEQKAIFVENMILKEEVKKAERIARLNEELSNKVQDLNIMNMVLQEIDWVNSSSYLFDLVVKLTAKITNSDEVYFQILDGGSALPIPVASYHGGSTKYRDLDSRIADLLAKRIQDGIPLLMNGNCDSALADDDIGSLIAIPLKIRDKLFGVLTAISRNGSARLTEKHVYYLNFLVSRATSVIENIALYENIYDNLFATLYAFVEAIEAKDPYTKQHSSRVTELAVMIGREMGCSDEELDLLRFSGHLHDIGKIGIPDGILLKAGSLNDDEYEAIKKHPVIGANIVGHLGLLTNEQEVILHHHERWDGKGYPGGLKGESIPFLSRIISVADVYDAMASDRAYRKKLAADVVVDAIRKNAGSQFDPLVVEAFLAINERGDLRIEA